ncbi:MAG TPA: hypothetical protein VIR01_15850, partial [Pyrinomonadaceae bacterium]
SGESAVVAKSKLFETHPTLPRIGTDRWLASVDRLGLVFSVTRRKTVSNGSSKSYLIAPSIVNFRPLSYD